MPSGHVTLTSRHAAHSFLDQLIFKANSKEISNACFHGNIIEREKQMWVVDNALWLEG